jgi:hypothetical protein
MINLGFATSAPKRELSDVQQEFDKLSAEDKESVINDLYGNKNISNLDGDDDAKIEKGIEDLYIAIQERVKRSSDDDVHIQYYIRANIAAPEFVNNHTLKVQFLYCEQFDVIVR